MWGSAIEACAHIAPPPQPTTVNPQPSDHPRLRNRGACVPDDAIMGEGPQRVKPDARRADGLGVSGVAQVIT